MTTLEAVVKNADRMMTSVRALSSGVEVTFADGRSGVIPFSDTRGMEGKQLADIELPSPHEIVLPHYNSRVGGGPLGFRPSLL